MSLRNHRNLVRSCPNISNRRTRRQAEWRVSYPAGHKVSVSRRDREGILRALGATIKGRPLNDARSKNTATAYSIVCNAALSLSLSFAVVALHVTGDCTKSASRDRQMRQICPSGRHNGERVRVIHVRLHSFEAPEVSSAFRFRAHSRILFVAAHDILVLCKM